MPPKNRGDHRLYSKYTIPWGFNRKFNIFLQGKLIWEPALESLFSKWSQFDAFITNKSRMQQSLSITYFVQRYQRKLKIQCPAHTWLQAWKGMETCTLKLAPKITFAEVTPQRHWIITNKSRMHHSLGWKCFLMLSNICSWEKPSWKQSMILKRKHTKENKKITNSSKSKSRAPWLQLQIKLDKHKQETKSEEIKKRKYIPQCQFTTQYHIAVWFAILWSHKQIQRDIEEKKLSYSFKQFLDQCHWLPLQTSLKPIIAINPKP